MTAWTIIRARGGLEAKAVACLTDNGIPAYCPMEREWVPSREPYTRTRDRALIPGYVFADLPENVPLSRVTGPGAAALAGLLMVNGVVAKIPSRHLGYLIVLEALGHFDHTLAIRSRRRKRYVQGERVQIVGGHLKGAVGEIMKTPRGDRLQLLIDFGRGGFQRATVHQSEVDKAA